MAEWWDQDWGEGLPIGTPDRVRQILEQAGSLFKMRPELGLGKKLQIFFMDALVPYFDCMWDGMDQTAANIIYRLSDRIPPHIRNNIGVYPRAVRREQMFHVEASATTEGWTTLEEWRREWEVHNKNIPPLQDLLPEGVTLHLGTGDPEPAPVPGRGIIDVSSGPSDAEQEFARESIKLLREKERAIYWVCRLATDNSDLARTCALSYLQEISYDERRIRQMVDLGEPPK